MRFSVDKTENKKQDFWVTSFLFLLLYLLWLDESWLSSMRIFAAASRVTVCVLDTRKSMTNFWLITLRDLSFRLLTEAGQDKQELRKSDYCTLNQEIVTINRLSSRTFV